jgi:hypothetical protein
LQQEAGQARWRALHEVAVAADFLAPLGVDIAVRYFAHEGIETWRAMVEFQKYAERLGDTPYSAVHVRQPANRLCSWDRGAVTASVAMEPANGWC